jgi:hypothetical protein
MLDAGQVVQVTSTAVESCISCTMSWSALEVFKCSSAVYLRVSVCLLPMPMHIMHMQIELGEQLSQAGSLGSTSSLTNTLVGLLGGKPSLNGQALPQPTEAVLVGFIVAVAMSELSRAALAPLPDLGE